MFALPTTAILVAAGTGAVESTVPYLPHIDHEHAHDLAECRPAPDSGAALGALRPTRYGTVRPMRSPRCGAARPAGCGAAEGVRPAGCGAAGGV
ncbi:hypothetical protein [Micromonospora rosaria]|uniref:hypothetical protein n=1 Tax=Micromonospora rosaria TaxID=47874 RepID=UPI000B18462F|nr:hypothetical protein [Micromonospora rosaria]